MYARGAPATVTGAGNVVAGTGIDAVESRGNASLSGLSGTDTADWSHRAGLSFASYLEYHPLASLWLGILGVILLAAGWSFRRKLPGHPYPASVRREYQPAADGGPPPAADLPRPRPASPGPAFRPARRAAAPTTWDLPVVCAAGGPARAGHPQPSFQPASARTRSGGEPGPGPGRPATGPDWERQAPAMLRGHWWYADRGPARDMPGERPRDASGGPSRNAGGAGRNQPAGG